jgi:hypothetical protein
MHKLKSVALVLLIALIALILTSCRHHEIETPAYMNTTIELNEVFHIKAFAIFPLFLCDYETELDVCSIYIETVYVGDKFCSVYNSNIHYDFIIKDQNDVVLYDSKDKDTEFIAKITYLSEGGLVKTAIRFNERLPEGEYLIELNCRMLYDEFDTEEERGRISDESTIKSTFSAIGGSVKTIFYLDYDAPKDYCKAVLY